MTIAFQFLGAARHVTGSKHLLEIDETKVLFDCGMVQWPRRISEEQNRKLPVDASKLDAVVLSHAHIDHSGSSPKLVKDGYDGPIWCTDATAETHAKRLTDAGFREVSVPDKYDRIEVH